MSEENYLGEQLAKAMRRHNTGSEAGWAEERNTAEAVIFVLQQMGYLFTPAAQWRAEGRPDPHDHRYECERARLFKGHMTDDYLANEVYLTPDIANLTAAKDRIRWLSRALQSSERLRAGVALQRDAAMRDAHNLRDELITVTAERNAFKARLEEVT